MKAKKKASTKSAERSRFYCEMAEDISCREPREWVEGARFLFFGWSCVLLGEELSVDEPWTKLAPKLTSANLERFVFPSNLSERDWKSDIELLASKAGAGSESSPLDPVRFGEHLRFLESSSRDLATKKINEPFTARLRQPKVLVALVFAVYLGIGYLRARSSEMERKLETKTLSVPASVITPERPSYYFDELSQATEEGLYWGDSSNKAFEAPGIVVYLRRPMNIPRLSISLDGNDSYVIRFLEKERLIAGVVVGPGSGPGMRARNLRVPFPDSFERIEILPLTGDNRYSLGHIELKTNTP